MTHHQQLRIPAAYLRGGTSKGVFYRLEDLPPKAQTPGPFRDQMFLRIIGSPDAYGRHIDGMGGATSSTSKTVIISESSQPGHDVDYLFGQAAIDQPILDWTGNCGNLTPAVGVFAIMNGYIPKERIPENGVCKVRIWQANIHKTLETDVPIVNGQVQETGHFMLDGVPFPAAEIKVTFVDPSDASGASVFPSGAIIDTLDIPEFGPLEATLIDSGIPMVCIRAQDVGLTATERQDDINTNAKVLALLESIRIEGSVRMGLTQTLEEASARAHTPKVAFLAPPTSYVASNGKTIQASEVDLVARAISMGKMHHALMGTAGVALATAAAVPGTLVNEIAGGGQRTQMTVGHTAGKLSVSASVTQTAAGWKVNNVGMSRSARVIMEGWVRVPIHDLDESAS